MLVLLSEGESLTARETLTVLGASGDNADLLTSRFLALGRFSRWSKRCIPLPSPSGDPFAYLTVVRELLNNDEYAALLPTHEQAWLFAAGRRLLPLDAPLAVASIEAFDRVQGKIDFALLADEIDIPQPRWWPIADRPAIVPYPHWVKASYGTAGRSVRLVHDPAQEAQAIRQMSARDGALMGQVPAPGQYGQVQALFDHGRLIAAHTSVQIGFGAGGSAAARLSVDHPAARASVTRLGRHLAWHGGLTLDYFHVDGEPQFVECNPRTVEPANAAASGVDLPALTIALSTGGQLPSAPIIGTAGIRTRSAMALIIGAAEREGTRAAILRILTDCVLARGEIGHAAEVLTPIRRDPRSLVPLVVTALRLLRRPASVTGITRGAVDDYAVSHETITMVRADRPSTEC